MDSGSVVVLSAGIAAVVGVVSPLLLSRLNAHQAHATQVAEWARQDVVAEKAAAAVAERERREDEVAAQAAEAARLLLAANAEVARLAKSSAESAAVSAERVDEKLDAVTAIATTTHKIVNSQRDAMIAEAEIRKTEIAELKTIVRAMGGVVPAPPTTGGKP